MKNKNIQIFIAMMSGLFTVSLMGCSEPTSEDSEQTRRSLYVSSGACYSGGGVTTFSNLTASNLVFRINLATNAREVLADYNASPAQAGDSPVGLMSLNSDEIMVLIENPTTPGVRRIEQVPKKVSASRTIFSNNMTALNTTLRSIHRLSNGDLLVSKSTAVEKITSSNVRILKGSNPFISAPAAPCATSTTLVPKITTLANQFIVFLHAAAGQNRFAFVRPDGYSVAADCSSAQSAPNANSFPVATVYDAARGILLVAYAGSATTTDINSIYAYTLTETASTVTVTNPRKIYDASGYPGTYPYLLFGISAMAFDPVESALYVATATNTSTTVSNFSIEKLKYNPLLLGVTNASVLTRVGTQAFYSFGGDTKCISDLMIAD